jgi:hypothetical protein
MHRPVINSYLLKVAFLLTLLVCSSTIAFAAPSPKPGAPCLSAGVNKTVKGTKYTCTKSGGKLQWSKLAKKQPKIPVTSKPSPTPSPSPTSTKVLSVSERWDAIDRTALNVAQNS